MTIAILEADPLAAGALRDVLGNGTSVVGSFDALGLTPGHRSPHPTIVIGPSVDAERTIDLASAVLRIDPTCGIVLVRQRVDAAVLAAAMRAGVREVVSDRDHTELAAAVRRAGAATAALRGGNFEQSNDHSERTFNGKVFTIWSAKGGSGKSSTAVNVAATLSTQGHKTLLVDYDLGFGDVAISLGLHPEHTWVDVADLGERFDVAALRRTVTAHESGLHILAAPAEPGHETVPSDLLRHVLTVAKSEYEYVVVDTAPVLDDGSVTVMEQSDTVFVVVTLDIPALKNTKVALNTLRVLNFPTDRLHVVVNRADAKTGLNLSEVAGALSIPVVAHIPSSDAVPAATNRGVALVIDQPRHPVSRAFAHLVASQITHEAVPTERRRLFARRAA